MAYINMEIITAYKTCQGSFVFDVPLSGLSSDVWHSTLIRIATSQITNRDIGPVDFFSRSTLGLTFFASRISMIGYFPRDSTTFSAPCLFSFRVKTVIVGCSAGAATKLMALPPLLEFFATILASNHANWYYTTPSKPMSLLNSANKQGNGLASEVRFLPRGPRI